MNKAYNNKTVLITGSSRGLGAAIASVFAKNNCNVVINYVNDKTSAENLSAQLAKKYSVQTLVVQGDISKEEDVRELVDQTMTKFSTIDYLVNNAGIAIDTTLEDKTPENFRRILDVNLIGTFLMTKYVGKIMLNQGTGSIVNIASANAIDSFYPYGMDYDASKSGVISLTHNFALEYAPIIRVNCIAPGWINTPMNKELDTDFIKEECEHILLNRFAEPEEIASCVYFAATASYLNDSIIKIDGGHK